MLSNRSAKKIWKMYVQKDKEIVLTSGHVLRNLGILFEDILSFCKRFCSSGAQTEEYASGSCDNSELLEKKKKYLVSKIFKYCLQDLKD